MRNPERIVENLEAIVFLNVDRAAFVIGADPRIVEHDPLALSVRSAR